jgi:hypothetical protein
MPAKKRARKGRPAVMRQHGLSVVVGLILLMWLVLFVRSDPSTHLGAFFGNATADWLGTFVIVVATKYLYEIGSDESRPPHPTSRSSLTCFLVDHGLTIALLVTGAMWAALYARMDAKSKAAEVVGNIVSEWTQILGLVVMTKYVGEQGSKEGD